MARILALTGSVLAVTAGSAQAANLVKNGDFELFTGSGVGQIGFVAGTLTDWAKIDLKNDGAQGFAFLIDDTADETGFPSKNTPDAGVNICIWGPGNSGASNCKFKLDNGSKVVGWSQTPVANGFVGSPNGGKFVGIDGDYGQSAIEQTIGGLVPGTSYTLKFQWAGTQFTDEYLATYQYWTVNFGNESRQTQTINVPSRGFIGWLNETMTFTAQLPEQVLRFTPTGGPPQTAPAGSLPPFLLLDGVTLDPPEIPNISVPGPLPLLGAGASLVWSRKLRSRIRSSRSAGH